jgi:hypothetical protein
LRRHHRRRHLWLLWGVKYKIICVENGRILFSDTHSGVCS